MNQKLTLLSIAACMSFLLFATVGNAGYLEIITKTKDDRKHYNALVGFYVAEGCNFATGDFQSDVAFFRQPARAAESHYRNMGHSLILRESGAAKRRQWEKQLRNRNPAYQKRLCSSEIAKWRRKYSQ